MSLLSLSLSLSLSLIRRILNQVFKQLASLVQVPA